MLNIRGVHFNWHDSLTSQLGSLLCVRATAGWRRCCTAHDELGCRLDGLEVNSSANDLWLQAVPGYGGLILRFTRTCARSVDEILPWDFIDIGVTKAYLKAEWECAKRADDDAGLQRTAATFCGLQPDGRVVQGMRMMVVFEKSYPLRHIGHLDLMRTMSAGTAQKRAARALQPGL